LNILKIQDFFRNEVLPLSVLEYSQNNDDRKQHAHEFCELVIVKSGSALHFTDACSFRVKAGDVFIIPIGFYHKYTEVDHLSMINVLYDPDSLPLPVLDMNDFAFFNIMFRPKGAFRENDLQLLLSLDDAQLAEIIKLSGSIADQRFPHEPGTQFTSLAAFMRMLSLLSGWHHREQHQHKYCYTAGKIMKYLNEHYSEPVDMNRLARLNSMSRRSMFRHFSNAAGCTPGTYLCRIRIKNAAYMLAQTAVPLKEIAERCGFCDSNYFSKQFRKIMHVSPLRYRRARQK